MHQKEIITSGKKLTEAKKALIMLHGRGASAEDILRLTSYLNIEEYALVNGRLGFKATKGLSAFVWVRNLFDKNYYEQLLPAGGNAGHYAGVLGDPRTYGVTLRYSIN